MVLSASPSADPAHPSRIRHTAEISILIAMPDPNHPAAADTSRHNSSLSTYGLPDYSPIYCYPTDDPALPTHALYDDDEDGRPLPLLEMGLSSIPVLAPGGPGGLVGAHGEVDDLIRKAAEEREAATHSRRRRDRGGAWNTVVPIMLGGETEAQQRQPAAQAAAPQYPDVPHSLAGRFAMIRNGALAGFGAAPTRR
jgi:hypothetical protein